MAQPMRHDYIKDAYELYRNPSDEIVRKVLNIEYVGACALKMAEKYKEEELARPGVAYLSVLGKIAYDRHRQIADQIIGDFTSGFIECDYLEIDYDANDLFRIWPAMFAKLR